jgi:acid phosphatase family membrane protein YuiD
MINITEVNDAPTLTTFNLPFASTNEDTEVEITFADLLAQGDAADIDGTVNAFVIKAVSTGTMKIGTTAGVATAWNASSNATIDATKKAYWTPVSNLSGILNAFTAVAKDNGGLESATAVQVVVSVVLVNDATVITTSGSLSYTEAGASAAIQPSLILADVDDTQITGGSISLTNPVTGDTLSFTDTGTITGIFSGGVLTLTGTDTLANYQAALREVSFSNSSSDPAVKGTRLTRTVTFSVTDANGSSATNGQQTTTTTSTINIIEVNDAPTLTTFTVPVASTNEDIEVEITFANLLAQGDAADIDGTVNSFVIKAVSTGTMKIGTGAGVATAWNASSNATIDASKKAYWTPASNLSGILNAFTAVAKDNGGLESATAVQVVVSVIMVNDATVITTSGSLSYTEAGAVAAIQPSLTLSDVDDTQITGGSISLTNPLDGDTLSFTDTGTITGIFSGGVLTLTGIDTLANYQAALREVYYSSTSNDPTVNGTRPTRTVTFSVTDANDSSAINGQQTGTTEHH